MALTDNIVAYWKLDESSGNAADSVGSNTLINTGTVTYSSGKINNGGNFDNGKYLSKANPTGLPTGSGAFSISIWVKFTNFSAARYFVGFGESTNNKLISIRCDSSTSWVVDDNGVGTAFPAVSAMSTGVWYQYTMTYPGSGNIYTAYLNGSSIGTANNTRAPNLGTTIISLGSNNGATAGENLVGSLDEVGIWSRALTSGEVAELYNSGNGFTYPFTSNYSMTADVGAFTLTGIDVAMREGVRMVAEVGSFVLSGLDVILKSTGWSNPFDKNNSDMTNRSKNTSTFTPENKSSSSWDNQNKS